MEIVIAMLVLVVGVGLLLGPRVARRRRPPVRATRSAHWNGAAASGVRTRAGRRAARATSAPAAAAYAPPADEDAWDDDLEWVDEPPADDAPTAPAPLGAPADPAAAPAPAAPQAPAGRTWGAGTATLADTHAPAAPAAALHAPPAAPATALHTPTATPARALGAVPAAPASHGATPARPLDAAPAPPAAPLDAARLDAARSAPRIPRGSVRAPDDIDGEWSTGVDVPPPRITRGAAAFGAASQPTVSKTKRGSFASRHPIVLVAAYAAAGIALVVIGVSVISSGSFRSSGAPAGERTTAEVEVKPSPVPTAVHTPAATPKPAATPEATPDPAKLQARRERAAWLRERRSARGAEARAVASARATARAEARRRAARKRRQSSGSGAQPASAPAPAVNPAPAPAAAPRPQARPQPPPCEFCIG